MREIEVVASVSSTVQGTGEHDAINVNIESFPLGRIADALGRIADALEQMNGE